MRKIFLLCLILVISTVCVPAASWYVDNTAIGGDGRSWAGAWKAFSNIQWGSILPGDTIFISGGQFNKTYTETFNITKSGTASSPITITVDTNNINHGGTVIFDQSYLSVANTSYISILGKNKMFLKNYYSTNAVWGNKILADSSTGFVLDSCIFDNVNQMVSLVYATKFNIQNNSGTNIRGDAAIRAVNSVANGFDVNFIQGNNIRLARYIGPQTYPILVLGPDGIQGSHGLTIRNNIITVDDVTYFTSYQHPDYLQIIGNFNKVYNNEFINIADSAIDMDWWANLDPHDIWIFNNIFRTTRKVDPYPEYIRWYVSGGNHINSLRNLKIFNNLFIDNTWLSIYGTWGSVPPGTISGIEIKNNSFINASILISNTPALLSSSIEFSNNNYYNCSIKFRDINYNQDTWNEANKTIGLPKYIYYVPQDPNNDFHLMPTDFVALDRGANLINFFSFDKSNNSRPYNFVYDIGPYELQTDDPPPILPPVINAGPDTAVTLPNNQITLNGSAYSPSAESVTPRWSEVSGPGQAAFNSVNILSPTVTFPVQGNYILRLTGTTTSFTVSDDVNVVVLPASTVITNGLSFNASSGAIINSPMLLINGSIGQTVETPLSNSGRAVYLFKVVKDGNYILTCSVNAPGDPNNSFFINVDAEPTDPYMVWDVLPFTFGFQNRQVSWRGNGTFDKNQFVPKVFYLTAGTHQLIIRGREANAKISSFNFSTKPRKPNNFVAILK